MLEPPVIAAPVITPADRDAIARATLRCTPTEVGPADTVALTMSVPHGQYLAIAAPDGTTFFAVYPADRRPPLSLLPADEFRRTALLRLTVAALRARPWHFGRDTLERVFTESGIYRLRVSESLETDEGWPVAECAVSYRGG